MSNKFSIKGLKINGVDIPLVEENREKAANYQVAMIRIEILADQMSRLNFADSGLNDMVDAYAGAIHALARLAQKENEV